MEYGYTNWYIWTICLFSPLYFWFYPPVYILRIKKIPCTNIQFIFMGVIADSYRSLERRYLHPTPRQTICSHIWYFHYSFVEPYNAKRLQNKYLHNHCTNTYWRCTGYGYLELLNTPSFSTKIQLGKILM